MPKVQKTFAMAILLGALGCNSPGSQPPVTSAAEKAEPAKPAGREAALPHPNELVVTGPVTVEQQLDVVTLRSGVIASLHADVGSHVKKGQLLAQLDDRQLIADRAVAEHKFLSVQADLKNWGAEMEVKKVDMQRSEEMHKSGINTQEQFDHDRYALTATQFEVDRQREEMLEAQSAVNSIDLELEKTKITAPFSGVIAQRLVKDGEYATSGEKLFWLTAEAPLEVRFTLPGNEVTSLKKGDLVAVWFGPDSGHTTTARVSVISPVIDPASGMISVTAILSGKPHGILPGMIAEIRIPTPIPTSR